MAAAATADRQTRMLVMHERTLSRAAAELATCQAELAATQTMLEAAGASESASAAGMFDSLAAQVDTLQAREDALLQRRADASQKLLAAQGAALAATSTAATQQPPHSPPTAGAAAVSGEAVNLPAAGRGANEQASLGQPPVIGGVPVGGMQGVAVSPVPTTGEATERSLAVDCAAVLATPAGRGTAEEPKESPPTEAAAAAAVPQPPPQQPEGAAAASAASAETGMVVEGTGESDRKRQRAQFANASSPTVQDMMDRRGHGPPGGAVLNLKFLSKSFSTES